MRLFSKKPETSEHHLTAVVGEQMNTTLPENATDELVIEMGSVAKIFKLIKVMYT